MIYVPLQFAYFVLVIPFAVVWILLFILSKNTRKEQLFMGMFFLPFGPLSELLYVKDYWNPLSVFTLNFYAVPIGIEDLLFPFFVGGIGAILYRLVLRVEFMRLKRKEKHTARFLVLAVVFSIAITVLIFNLGLNSIFSTSIGLVINSFLLFLHRRELIRGAIVSGFLCTASLFCCYLILYYSVSNVEQLGQSIWKLYDTPYNLRLLHIPITELVWAYCAGFSIFPIYPYLFNLTERKKSY